MKPRILINTVNESDCAILIMEYAKGLEITDEIKDIKYDEMFLRKFFIVETEKSSYWIGDIENFKHVGDRRFFIGVYNNNKITIKY